MSASLDSTPQGDWKEDVYQKIKTMKENYLPELNEIQQKIATKLRQSDSLPHQPKSDQFEKLMVFKNLLDRLIAFLLVSKSNISPTYKMKLDSYEKKIIMFINTNKPRQTMPSLQAQIQVTQVQSHENQMNSQLQANIEGLVAAMQHNSLSSVSAAQQSTMNTTAAAIFPTSSSACIKTRVSQLQANIQGSVAAMQHNSLSSVSAAQQSTMNTTAAAIFPTSSSACIKTRVSQLQANIQGSVAAIQHNSLSSVSAAQQSTMNTTAAAIFPTSSSACIKTRVSEIAQAMIDRHLTIQPDTEGWHLAQELLSLARPPCTSVQTPKRTRTTQ